MKKIVLGYFTVLILILSCAPQEEQSALLESTPSSSNAEAAQVRPRDAVFVQEQAVLPHPLSMEVFFSRNFVATDFKNLETLTTENGTRARIVEYGSEGNRVRALLEMPDAEIPEGGLPVIVLAHGYIPPDIYTTEGSYRLVTRHYAKGGFLVVKPDYRGHGFSEGSLDGPYRTPLYTLDVMNILASLEKVPEADINNVFLYGHSMGGEIALRVLEAAEQIGPVKLKAATLWAAVSKPFPENSLYFIRKRDPGSAAAQKIQVDNDLADYDLEDFSPLKYLSRIGLPMYVHHGTEDESVPFEWSVELMKLLETAGVEAEFFEYPGENHNISKSFYSVMDQDMAFFRKYID